jgi:outer membrane protein OmpA-like peptidoglycan-associated protein
MMGCNRLQENNYEADRLPACAGQRPTDSPTYLVFFDQHSEVVNPRQLPIVKEFVSSLSDYRDLTVGVVASTDTSEVLLRDQNLDLRRGQAVERLLREDGIAADAKIRIFPEGSKRLFVPTPPLTAEPQNRNVWLHIQDGKRVRPTYWQAACIDWLRTHRCDPQVSAEQAAVCKRVEKVAQEFHP